MSLVAPAILYINPQCTFFDPFDQLGTTLQLTAILLRLPDDHRTARGSLILVPSQLSTGSGSLARSESLAAATIEVSSVLEPFSMVA